MKIPPPAPYTENETTDVLRPVLLHTSALGAMVWRENSGLYRTLTGRRVVRASTPGCGDIIGLVSLSVEHLHSIGILRIGAFVSIETKTQRGTLRASQLEFRSAVQAHDGLYIVARGPSDVDKGIGHLLL